MSITEQPALNVDESSYEVLRGEAISILARLAGENWSDHNAHDPGITILDQFCYALTDLLYRIDYDIKDLLVDAGPQDPYHSLYGPAEILTTTPVTLVDFRKAIIDIPGVKNVWFEQKQIPDPAIYYSQADNSLYLSNELDRRSLPVNGIYRVLLEGDNTRDAPSILQEAHNTLHQYRQLGQDFEYPTILDTQNVTVEGTIEVDEIDEPNVFLAKLYHAIANFLSPQITFYSLDEMLDKGYAIEQVLQGPRLTHGYIIDEELDQFQRHSAIRASDLIQVIMTIPGVKVINAITVMGDPWYVEIRENSTPYFDHMHSRLTLVRKQVPLPIDTDAVKRHFDKLQRESQRKLPTSDERFLHKPQGNDRQVETYFSLQHQLPALYGIGEYGLPASAKPMRHAQAKQLKAYLLFFDQLLSNCFAQLANAKELLSFHPQQTSTYFAQLMELEPLGLTDVIGRDREQHLAVLKQITENPYDEKLPRTTDRRNRFLNHLLARFAEDFTDYALVQHGGENEQVIADKLAFLQDYKTIGASKGRGYNRLATQPTLSGLERRLNRKMGMRDMLALDLSTLPADDPHGGFYLIENLLLRPQKEDIKQWRHIAESVRWQKPPLITDMRQPDPYSNVISFLLPDWIDRFNKTEIRTMVNNIIQDESPAHLRANIYWLNQSDMQKFESAYSDWLHSELNPTENAIVRRDARDRMLIVLGIGNPTPIQDLTLQYPLAVNHDTAAEIQITYAQANIRYLLCDEDGHVISVGGKTFSVTPSENPGKAGAVLETPKITKDVTYTILATRDLGDDFTVAEAFLNQSVSIKAGINAQVPVRPLPSAQQSVVDGRLIVNYDDTFKLAIDESQEGISYLMQVDDTTGTTLSDTVVGNQATIELTSEKVQEDLTVRILAFRTLDNSVKMILEQRVTVDVKPNTQVNVSINIPIAYNDTATISLPDAQTSTQYQLYRRPLTPSDYVTQNTPNRIEVSVDAQHKVYIQAPPSISDWSNPNGFVRVGDFSDTNDERGISVANLLEDEIMIVRAIKKDNGTEVQLAHAAVALVKPDPSPTVGHLVSPVAKNSEGVVTVDNTQQGVRYQLRDAATAQLINLPGADIRDRGLETTRVQVDLQVEGVGEAQLLLPTNPLTKKTTFDVLAIKVLSGVTETLSGTTEISVTQT